MALSVCGYGGSRFDLGAAVIAGVGPTTIRIVREDHLDFEEIVQNLNMILTTVC